MKMHFRIFTFVLFLSFALISPQLTAFQEDIDTTSIEKKNPDLPMDPQRLLEFTTSEGTWMSVDVSPDGSTITFDLLGDIYTIPFDGGKATPVTDGMAFDSHPKWSPDGKHILYMSDKDGSDDAYYINLESEEEHKFAGDENDEMVNAAWSPDGDYAIVTRGRRNFKLWLYHKDGGRGIKLVDPSSAFKAIDPTFSPDGRYIYFSRRNSAWNYNAQFPQYSIGVYDRETGETSTMISRYGSAFTPTVSPNGKWMVYGTRYEAETGLVLRNLEDGSERWLAYPIQRDDQESQATLGVLPSMDFTPNSQELVMFHEGKIVRLNIDNSSMSEIPFEVDVALEMGPDMTFKYPINDDKEVLATQIRDAVPSPDGSQLAFTALNKLYVQDLPQGTPRRVTNYEHTEAHPTWSQDGKFIAYVTWNQDEGGHIYKVDPNARRIRPQQLTQEAAFYSSPAWSYNSDRIAFIMGNKYDFMIQSVAWAASIASDDLAWIASDGGAINFIAKTSGRSNPHFAKADDRIYLSNNNGTLVSIRWDGSDEKEHASITGSSVFGTSDPVSPSEASIIIKATIAETITVGRIPTEIDGPHGITVSPDGKHWFVSIAHGNPYGFLAKYETGTNKLVGITDLGMFPATMEISQKTGLLYVVNFDLHGPMRPSNLMVVDPQDMEVLDVIDTGVMPHGSRISPDGAFNYHVSMMSDELIEVSTTTMEVTRKLKLSEGMETMASGEDHSMHQSSMSSSGMSHSGMVHNPIEKPTWADPHPTKDLVYVAANGSDEILEIDLNKWTITRRFKTGKAPYNLEVSSDGKWLVATYKGEGSTGIWNLDSGKETVKLANTRRVSHGVTISPDSKYAFVSVEGIGGEPGSVEVIDIEGKKVVDYVETGKQAGGIYFWKMEN